MVEELPEYDYRARCLLEKGDECVVCGDPEVVVHHIDGDRDNNDLDNLVPMCTEHHSDTHNGFTTVPEKYVTALGWTPHDKDAPKTTIQIDDETWRRLNHRRESGETFNHVVEQLLDQAEVTKSA